MNAAACITIPPSTSRDGAVRIPGSEPSIIAWTVSTAADTYTAGYTSAESRSTSGSDEALAAGHKCANVSASAAAISGSVSDAASARSERDPAGTRTMLTITRTANAHDPTSVMLGDRGVPITTNRSQPS